MAKKSSKVLFRFGSRKEYEALTKKDPNSLYFLLDTHELYRGAVPIGVSHFYEGAAQEGEPLVNTIERILGPGNYPVINDIMMVKASDDVQDLYIYTSSNEWKHLNANIRSGNVIFADGKTLNEKLSEIGSGGGGSIVNINQGALSIDNGLLSIRDYGKRYYKYIPEVPALGIEGQLGYVPPVPAHYELIQVDSSHPWKEGLFPQINADGNVGWYETNKLIDDAVKSLTDMINAIININDTQTTNIEDLQNLVLKLNGLSVIVGTMSNPSTHTPSTGLVKRVEDLEALTHKKLTIKLNNKELAEVDGTINIPLFGADRDGAVPKFRDAIGSINQLSLSRLHLTAAGWRDTIGSLEFNHVTYNNVTEYVDARVEDSTLQWQNVDK